MFVEILLNSLKDKPSISRNSALAIENLAQSLKALDPTQQSNQLTPLFEQIAGALTANTQRDCTDQNSNILSHSYSALISLVKNSCQQSAPLVYQMMMHYVKLFEQSLQVNQDDRVSEH